MPRIKIYGLDNTLTPIRTALSDTIHSCLVDVFQLPPTQRFQRFFPMDADNFMVAEGHSPHLLIIEIACFEGRSIAAKRRLVQTLFDRIQRNHGIAPDDVEITITETPRHNWGIRGTPGDELVLRYPMPS